MTRLHKFKSNIIKVNSSTFEETVIALFLYAKKKNEAQDHWISSLESEITNFKTNQANVNATFKILENQMGQLVLAIQRQPSKTFPDDANEIPRECETRSLSNEQELFDGGKNEFEMEEELSKHLEVVKVVLG